MRLSVIIAAGAALLSALSATAADGAGPPPAEPAAVRMEFQAALQRVREQQPDNPDSQALEGYILHDYLVAARLRRDLATRPSETLDRSIDEFLTLHAGQPVARSLRHHWLANLADRGRWDLFLTRSADVTESSLVCERLAGRLATGQTAGLKEDALARWNLIQKQPDECAPVFAWLRSQGALTPALAESHARAALAADNPRAARDFLIDVPQPQAAPLMQWIQLLAAPQSSLALLSIDPAKPVEADALAAGFSKLCLGNISAALSLLPGLLKRPEMTPALRSRLQRAAALGSASSRLPGAVAAFAGLSLDAGDTQAQEWRARAALWAGDYRRALAWIEQMPATLSAQPRWRYWRARAVSAQSGAEAAAPLFQEIAGLRDYYGYLAADRLDRAYSLNNRPSVDDAAVQAELAGRPGMLRAHELFVCDLADDAAAEWAAELGSAAPDLKIQAAHLASRWGWYAQTIATLAQAGEWDDVVLRYPRPFAAIVEEAARQTRVPADWLFAVMRQESLFRKDAVSRADARGLMQMQPATAAAVARHWHLQPPGRQSLFDPNVAVPFGAWYVRELLDKYHGQLAEALAAYNAGPLSVARWAPDGPVDADVWIENIPYTETRGYVQHILEHIVAFAWVRNSPPPRLSELLTTIAPSMSAAP